MVTRIITTKCRQRKSAAVEPSKMCEPCAPNLAGKALVDDRTIARTVLARTRIHQQRIEPIYRHQLELETGQWLTGVVTLENIQKPQPAITCHI